MSPAQPEPVASLTWPRVLAFRLRRQLLAPRSGASAVDVARALLGVQAQVASAAELAVAARQRAPTPGEVSRAIGRRRLVKAWAARGTLHLLAADQAPTIVATLSRLRPWEAPAWQRFHGVSSAEVGRVCDAIADVLGADPITREELIAQVSRRVRSRHIREKLGSGWSELLRPAAFQGLLLQGPPRDGRVTFVRPDAWVKTWRLPDVDDAGADLVRSYLATYGPATMQWFGDWWARQRASVVRSWFERLGDEIVPVDVDGTLAWCLAADVRAIARLKPSNAVRLVPNFDQFVLGAGGGSSAFVPAKHKAEVSRTAGWISPVVLLEGRVAGVWELDREAGTVSVTEFEPIPKTPLASEVRRIGRFLGIKLEVA